jgi:hypothetical protein
VIRRLVVAGVLTCAALAATSTATSDPALKVVAMNLDNPRKLFLAPDGALYVVEAGKGGSEKCFGTGTNAVCVGRSGSVTRISEGIQRRVVTGLVSWAMRSGERALGPAAVVVRGDIYDVLLDDDTVQSDGTNDLGPAGATAGTLISTRAGKVAPKVVANLAAFEAAHNPDRGAGPGRALGNPPIDSDPYGFVPYRGGYAVVDAGANDLLWVSPKGKISVLAVFPTQRAKLTKAAANRIGAPSSMTSIEVQSVPSCVTVGPDGALYVGELTARPFIPGTARIWRVVPGKKPELYGTGFTNISDLAFQGNDLLVLEIADRGLYDPRSTGALFRLAADGTRSVVARRGLRYPAGLAVKGRTVFVANNGVFPGSGRGPRGEVVALQMP